MTAICAFRPSTAASSNRMTPSHHGGPDPDALIRIRGRLAAHGRLWSPGPLVWLSQCTPTAEVDDGTDFVRDTLPTRGCGDRSWGADGVRPSYPPIADRRDRWVRLRSLAECDGCANNGRRRHSNFLTPCGCILSTSDSKATVKKSGREYVGGPPIRLTRSEMLRCWSTLCVGWRRTARAGDLRAAERECGSLDGSRRLR